MEDEGPELPILPVVSTEGLATSYLFAARGPTCRKPNQPALDRIRPDVKRSRVGEQYQADMPDFVGNDAMRAIGACDEAPPSEVTASAEANGSLTAPDDSSRGTSVAAV